MLIDTPEDKGIFTYPAILEAIKFVPYGITRITIRFDYEEVFTSSFTLLVKSTDKYIIVKDNSFLQELLDCDYILPEDLENLFDKGVNVKLSLDKYSPSYKILIEYIKQNTGE